MRLKDIIFSDLNTDRLKSLERIERAMNSTDDLEDNCEVIKEELRELALNAQMIELWALFTTKGVEVDNNDNKK